MVFKLATTAEPVIANIAARLRNALGSQQQVLWLVPGGSAITIAVAVSKQLQDLDLSKLSVTLTDERYGPLNHRDSNWHQLKAAGFSLPGAKLLPVLSSENVDLTTKHYNGILNELFALCTYKLGLFGIGADGHTAGILPGSPAVTSSDLAIHYRAKPFERITMTPKAITKLDVVIASANGDTKHQALDDLAQEIEVAKEPAQILKTVKDFSVYNDYKGDPV